jgi:hypothetical protein
MPPEFHSRYNSPTMWLRFETHFRHPSTQWASGVFQETGLVVDSPDTPQSVRSRLLELRRFFNAHLPVPAKQQIDSKAIFWFKGAPDLAKPVRVSPWKRRPLTKLAARTPRVHIPSDRLIDRPKAAEVIARVQEVVDLLNKADVPARVITTSKPGYIVYEDEYQIAALPFRDTRRDVGIDGWLID